MKIFPWLSILLGCPFILYAQDTTSSKDMEEVIIYSSKFAENKKNIVQKIDVVSSRRIAQVNAQNTGDLLLQTGNVFVQKSQQGGSSPVIRGFEASRVLLVVDGIRMNNAIYRAGHLQNVITIDQNMLERIEVLYGPASTIYGSDALGGVVHFRTKQPALSTDDRLRTTGSAFARYSTVNDEKTVHSDMSIGGKKLAWLQSYNYSEFGDMRIGRKDHKDYPGFGHRPYYVKQVNGLDSIVANSDPHLQKFSGYSQWDITQKLLFRQNNRISHLLNLQYSNSTDVPRYDRLQDTRNGTLRFAEWYYGPQLREMAAYEFNLKDAGIINEIRSIISYQHIRESRHQREYRKYDREDHRTEDLKVYAFTVDGRKLWKHHELTAGVDGQLNDVQSSAYRKNRLTGVESPLDSRYPNGDNDMNYFGVYVQHLMKSKNGKFILNDGLRYQFTRLTSSISDNSFFNFPFTSISQQNSAITGNLGLVYLPQQFTRITAGFSTGFRTPNIDDLSRIFESNTASMQLIVPNPGIEPEYTYNFDLTATHTIAGRYRFEVGGFYTLFHNAIALAPYRLHGQDSILYNGTMSAIYANQNVNEAYLYGFNAAVYADLLPQLNLHSTINYTYGRLQPAGAREVPLDHIPPVYGRTSFTYTAKKVTAELYALYNGWKKMKHYNPSGEDNAQYATTEGTPAWWTLNWKGSLRVNKIFMLQLGVENIFDRNYRLFASGFSSGGRNFIVSMRATL